MAEKKVPLKTIWRNIQQGKQILLEQGTNDASLSVLLTLDVNALHQQQTMAEFQFDASLYTRGCYWDLLRQLEDSELMTPTVVVLRILCLLHLVSSDERIGGLSALEYLRDKVTPQLKQIEHTDESGRLKQYREWLNRFCLGHELPAEFWSASRS